MCNRLTCVLSTITYYLVEKPFRDKKRIGVRTLLVAVSAALVISSAVSFYIYSRGGVLKDIPELDINRSDVTKNIHIRYNARIYDYDRDFVSSDKIKTLVIGNSFARDWVNVLLESRYADGIEISYIFDPEDPKVRSRSQQADVVFYSTPPVHNDRQIGIPPEKLWVVGPKNFGISNGVFYNYRGSDYYLQRTAIEKKYADENNLMKQDWSPRYIDLIAKVVDARQTVPVFTPTRKFISRDCRHFTQAGAKYYAGLFDSDLGEIFANVKK